MKETVVIVLCSLGLFFSLSGAIGIVRMADVYCRIQCSSKTVTMGALPTLVALLVAVLLMVVNPAASHAIARAAYKAGVPMWPGAVRDEPRQR